MFENPYFYSSKSVRWCLVIREQKKKATLRHKLIYNMAQDAKVKLKSTQENCCKSALNF